MTVRISTTLYNFYYHLFFQTSKIAKRVPFGRFGPSEKKKNCTLKKPNGTSDYSSVVVAAASAASHT